jgi:ABC-type Na+ efflux pump permease subunit
LATPQLGTVKVNGVPAKLDMAKSTFDSAKNSLRIEAQKLVNLNDDTNGPWTIQWQNEAKKPDEEKGNGAEQMVVPFVTMMAMMMIAIGIFSLNVISLY